MPKVSSKAGAFIVGALVGWFILPPAISAVRTKLGA